MSPLFLLTPIFMIEIVKETTNFRRLSQLYNDPKLTVFFKIESYLKRGLECRILNELCYPDAPWAVLRTLPPKRLL